VEGGGLYFFWHASVLEQRWWVEQRLTEVSEISNRDLSLKLSPLFAQIREQGVVQFRAISAANAVNTPRSSSSASEKTDLLTDVLDISIWKAGAPDSTFDVFPKAQRIRIGMNSGYTKFAEAIRLTEEAERVLVQPAFQGHSLVVLAPLKLSGETAALVIQPLKVGNDNLAVTAHLRLGPIQKNLSEIAQNFGQLEMTLVDDSGNVLAQGSSPEIERKTIDRTPLFQAAHSSAPNMGLSRYRDEKGRWFAGKFVRMGFGRLYLLNSGLESELASSLIETRINTVLASVCFLVFVSTLGILLLRWLKVNGLIDELLDEAESEKLADQGEISAQVGSISLIYGSIQHLHRFISAVPSHEGLATLNEIYSQVARTVKEYDGTFQLQGDDSFLAIWGAESTDGTEVWRALRCSLEIRRVLRDWNESRKMREQKMFQLCMGVHSGRGLLGNVGPSQDGHPIVVGEILRRAEQLSNLAATQKRDLLISQEIWKKSEARFAGDLTAEVKLVDDQVQSGVFSLTGYRDELGQVVSVEGLMDADMSPDVTEKGWLINNGSQILGPMTAEQIAKALFSQELDFDCECWMEDGGGAPAQIQNSGIFSGMDSKSACFWVFDGKTIHGPVNSGFIVTAIGHGALPHHSYVCEVSTTRGWVLVEKWLSTPAAKVPAPSTETRSIEDLRESLAPPKTSNFSVSVGDPGPKKRVA